LEYSPESTPSFCFKNSIWWRDIDSLEAQLQKPELGFLLDSVRIGENGCKAEKLSIAKTSYSTPKAQTRAFSEARVWAFVWLFLCKSVRPVPRPQHPCTPNAQPLE